MIDFDFKIKIDNIDDRINFQNILFKLNYDWRSGGKCIMNTEYYMFSVHTTTNIYPMDDNQEYQSIPRHLYFFEDKDDFKIHPFKEITYEQFLNLTKQFKFGR